MVLTMVESGQERLFADAEQDGSVVINARCQLLTRGGYRVVVVAGLPLAHHMLGDALGEAYAMVSLVEQGWASQREVASGFRCSERTVRRHQRRFEAGGLTALGRPRGYPRGRPRLPPGRTEAVGSWKAAGESNREIARRLGVSEKAVRKLLGRLGWKRDPSPEQLGLPVGVGHAEPNLSALGTGLGADGPAQTVPAVRNEPETLAAAADPNLSARSAVLGAGKGMLAVQAPPIAVDTVVAPADRNLSGLSADLGTSEPGQAVPTVEVVSDVAVTTADPDALAGAADARELAQTVPASQLGTSAARSAEAAASVLPVAPSFDSDPANRQIDRLLASIGLLDDAAPVFRSGRGVANAGVLLAVPALLDSGVVDITHDLYGSIGPAFYGLRTTVVTLLLMALMRIKRPEGLKEHSPAELGRLLGLDRAPEVKTLRLKLAKLGSYGLAANLGRALAARRVGLRGHVMGFLYVDGHVRAYHGKRDLPKGWVATRHLAMPATTDYWVNDVQGEPLLVVTCEANKSLSQMLPSVLDEVRALIGERRVTIVFDRGGWSPKLFHTLIGQGFDILTYRKGPSRRVPAKRFAKHEATIDGSKVSYVLADQGVRFLKGKLRLRQVTRLGDDGGHQISIITSRRDLSAAEVAFRMSERWRQENFFKYLRQEYALDALVDYSVEPADAERLVPNPKRKEMNAELRKAYDELNRMVASYGVSALFNVESIRRTMRGFKIANASLSAAIVDKMKAIVALEKRRAKAPTKIPVKRLVDGHVIKLAVERKLLADLFKMVAYQAEGDLLRLILPLYKRAEDDGRTLIQSALATAGDIDVVDSELRVLLEPLSSPHRTQVLATVCETLNETRTLFPGTNLQMCFTVKPEPPPSLAFPGPRWSPQPPDGGDGTKPDSLAGGGCQEV